MYTIQFVGFERNKVWLNETSKGLKVNYSKQLIICTLSVLLCQIILLMHFSNSVNARGSIIPDATKFQTPLQKFQDHVFIDTA